jgi:hypothetical protein
MTGKADPANAKSHSSRSREPAQPLRQDPAASIQELDPLAAWQALHGPGAITPAHILSLQRLVGNRSVNHIIQTKLAVGSATDPFERQADQVAEQVVGRQPTEPLHLHIEPAGHSPLVQRAVMTPEKWLEDSAITGKRRSKALKRIDAALVSYHQLAAQTDFGQMDDTAIMVSSYQLYDALREIRGHIFAWQGQRHGTERAGYVAELKRQVDAEIKDILKIRHSIQTSVKKNFQSTSPAPVWTAKWSGEDNEYILQCRTGSGKFEQGKVAEGLTINAIKWSSATEAVIHATRPDGVPSLWTVKVGVRGTTPFVNPPTPVVGGGRESLKAQGYEEVDMPLGGEKVDMEKKLFRALGVSRITDIHTLAAKILENVRAGNEIQYTTEGVATGVLRAGMGTEAVCHAIATVFSDVVNKMAVALDLPATAEFGHEPGLVISDRITAGFLGRDQKEPSNLVGSYKQSDRSLAFAKPHPGRVIFNSHTWVKIDGKHYDPVSGLCGATTPPVHPLAKGAEIDISVNGEAHKATVYTHGGLQFFSLPVPEREPKETPTTQLAAAWNQARPNLSAPLAEAWILLTP